MIKNYDEKVFTELVSTIKSHMVGDKSLNVFINMLTELDKKFSGIKNVFIHDMSSFLTHWFELVNDSENCSPKLRSKILNMDMIMQYSDFNRFTIYCYDKLEHEINPYSNRSYSEDLLNYLACIIKAIIQTARRKAGFDLNSTRYGITADAC